MTSSVFHDGFEVNHCCQHVKATGHKLAQVALQAGRPVAPDTATHLRPPCPCLHSAPSYCSYGCTKEGLQQLVQLTGTYDRWAEALAEATYGQLSLNPEPMILDSLDVPKDTMNAGGSAFGYTDYPDHPYLKAQGIDESRDYHTIVVSAVLSMLRSMGNLFMHCCEVVGTRRVTLTSIDLMHHALFK